MYYNISIICKTNETRKQASVFLCAYKKTSFFVGRFGCVFGFVECSLRLSKNSAYFRRTALFLPLWVDGWGGYIALFGYGANNPFRKKFF